MKGIEYDFNAKFGVHSVENVGADQNSNIVDMHTHVKEIVSSSSIQKLV